MNTVNQPVNELSVIKRELATYRQTVRELLEEAITIISVWC